MLLISNCVDATSCCVSIAENGIRDEESYSEGDNNGGRWFGTGASGLGSGRASGAKGEEEAVRLFRVVPATPSVK